MGNVFISVKDIELAKQHEYKWIDARFNLQDTSEGQTLYKESHIENAVYWDLVEDLSDMTKDAGRHPMPGKEQLKKLFEQSGLQQDQDILVYDQGGAPFATRAWWMLQYGGFTNVKVVQEGYDALVKAGFNTTNESKVIEPTHLKIDWQEQLYIDRNGVKEIVDGKVKRTLLDARSNIRYRGEEEPIDKVAGHIPGALNYDWEQLKQHGYLAPNDTILNVVSKNDPITVYCGSGVTASPLFAMLKEMDYKNVQLYTGSFSDWITKYEVEKGNR
ncbi:sulfurtransferase [uncultured Rummeliibacillus sp.]|uniref:sulfurtransferase n=1 Tax=uncultured Rummeliibacillus sp. TaxID=762292 RepID=UPI0026195B8E|nr:sulfurtransferase [uncultured Rummeliibacillus sp.]